MKDSGSFDQIFEELTQLEHRQPESDYLNFHHDRYQYLMKELRSLIALCRDDDPLQILDIGPAYQTYMVRALFNARVNSMGETSRFNVVRPDEKHFTVDLNATGHYKGTIIQHDVILFCEVLEHLYTQPETVLAFILRFLKPGGYLILQTPNAAATFKRIKMLLGRNPFELIREDRRGHYREYTSAELKRIFTRSGLEVIKTDSRNYFGYPESYQKIYRLLNRLMPAGFRDGLTIIGRKT